MIYFKEILDKFEEIYQYTFDMIFILLSKEGLKLYRNPKNTICI